jgi:[lysine-biosynthesis-protein LysW]---L-2-aminoadipate ligase
VFAIVAHRLSVTNAALLAAVWPGEPAAQLTPDEALSILRPGDVALGRLDVLPSVDGIEPGLEALRELESRGVTVLNGPEALRRAHDKLMTAQVLAAAGLPHPATRLAVAGAPLPLVDGPVVVKPRFGSWGREVILCTDRRMLAATLHDFGRHPWYPRTGALVQELIPPRGRDLRVLVAGGRVVGAIERVAAPGEWRTNVALGGRREAVSEPPADACELALLAAAAADADLVGVDLLPREGGWVIIELNGAVDFTAEYADGDVFALVAGALAGVAEPPLEAVS